MENVYILQPEISDRSEALHDEAVALIESAGAAYAGTMYARIREVNPATYIGEGKLAELCERLRGLDVTVLSEKLSSKNVAESIFSVTGSGTKSMGAGVNYVTTTTPSTSGLYGSWNTSISYSFEDNISTALVTTLGSGTYSSAALSVSYTGAGAKAYLTLVDSTGEATTLTGTNTTLKSSDFGSVNSLTFNTDYVEYLQVHDSYYEHSVGTYETVNSSAIQAASIPEPSAFGLLAGLGALALVASRRRRTKRA